MGMEMECGNYVWQSFVVIAMYNHANAYCIPVVLISQHPPCAATFGISKLVSSKSMLLGNLSSSEGPEPLRSP